MDDDQQLTPLPAEPGSWLARNRKLAILGGLTVVLIILAAVTSISLPKSAKTNTTAVNATTNAANTSAKTATRPTFQRSTVANVDTGQPASYKPPTTQDLQNAIQHSTNTP